MLSGQDKIKQYARYNFSQRSTLEAQKTLKMSETNQERQENEIEALKVNIT